jgi:glycosyltransferase involved in cell wall biosynthesis
VGAKPLVGVGLPVYNGEEFLSAAIESVLEQSFQDLQLIISDNASTDRTEEICRKYASRDSRVQYHRAEKNGGIVWNYNRVFEVSSNEYFMWFSHDDVLATSYVERCVEVLKNDSSVALCFSNWGEIDRDGKLLCTYKSRVVMDSAETVERFRAATRLDHLCEPWCGLTRSSIAKKTGLYGNYADYDRVLFAEIGLHGRFIEIPEALFFRREHQGRSIYLYPTRVERTAWLDPERGKAIVFPHFRELMEFGSAVDRAQLGWGERVACYWALLGWAGTHRRRLVMDAKVAALEIARRTLRWKSNVPVK